MASQVVEHINSHDLLYDLQHGFREKWSCAVNYLQFYAYAFQDWLWLYKVSPTRKSLHPVQNFPL